MSLSALSSDNHILKAPVCVFPAPSPLLVILESSWADPFLASVPDLLWKPLKLFLAESALSAAPRPNNPKINLHNCARPIKEDRGS